MAMNKDVIHALEPAMFFPQELFALIPQLSTLSVDPDPDYIPFAVARRRSRFSWANASANVAA